MRWRPPVVLLLILMLILMAGVLIALAAQPGGPRQARSPHGLAPQPPPPGHLPVASAGMPAPAQAQALRAGPLPPVRPPDPRQAPPSPAHLPGGAGCICLAQDRPLRLQQPPLAGPDVQEVQEILKKLGYLAEVTGRYDEATEEAVRRFQREHGLDADGIVGPATWLVLLGAVPGRVVIPELLELPPLEELPDRFVVIDTGLRTLTLYDNGRLRRRYDVAIGKPGSPTPLGSWQVVHKASHWGGAFGTRWLGLDIPWGRYGIHGTNQPHLIGGEVSAGCIRMQNWAVEELYDLVPEGTRVYIVGPVPVRDSVYPGEAGTDVLEIQRSLAALGLYRGNLDGWFGPATAAALRLFQEHLRIDEGGRVGPRTLEALGLY